MHFRLSTLGTILLAVPGFASVQQAPASSAPNHISLWRSRDAYSRNTSHGKAINSPVRCRYWK
jgi:hypothetical protein